MSARPAVEPCFSIVFHHPSPSSPSSRAAATSLPAGSTRWSPHQAMAQAISRSITGTIRLPSLYFCNNRCRYHPPDVVSVSRQECDGHDAAAEK